MSTTVDNVVYETSLHHSGEKADKPFLSKENVYVIDENGSTDYSRNQVVFSTISLSNGGRYCDWSSAYVSIPVVATIERSGTHIGDESQGLRFKSGPIMIDSVTVEYGNSTVVQERRDISAYASFKQHTTLSQNDVTIMGDSFNYYKPSSWFRQDADQGGLHGGDADIIAVHPEFTVLGGPQAPYQSDSNVKSSGADCYEKVGDRHVFYKDFRVRLKDLLLFDQLPMVRGSNVRITLTLNQASLAQTFTTKVLTSASYTLRGAACPILRVQQDPDGSFTETTTVSVVKSPTGETHHKTQCRLYVDTYQMEEQAELQYLKLGVQKVLYTDVMVSSIKNVSGTFQNLISNSLSRMKRLIIVPMLNKAENALNYSPMESPYCSEPSTTSPHYIRDFNVSLSGNNIYKQGITFKYDQFLNELQGKFGLNGGQVDGLSSSLISMKDYESMFGYIVVDLSRRRSSDDNVPLSLEISGSVQSTKALDFLVFVEFERDCEIDIATGALL